MSAKTFEPVLLPLSEKEHLVRELLSEFNLPIHSHSSHRNEFIVPCRVSARHKNQDREPTGAVNYDKLVYKCLGCQASGGLLWFIATHRNSSATEARDWLAKETGTDGQIMELSSLLRYVDALYGPKMTREPMPSYSAQFLDPWMLLHPWVTDPPDYDPQGRNIGGWGVPEETAIERMIGYAEEYPMGTKDHPAPPSERIVIPHFWKDRLVGWQTRRVCNDGTPKYKSSPSFPKDTTLYGYDPDHHKVAVVVESPKSSLRHSHHVHMIATFGANITESQIRLLGRYEKVIFWLDNDPAGWDACSDLKDNRGKITRLSVLEATSQMTQAWAVSSPYSADPAEIEDDDVEALVEEAVPWVIWRPPTSLLCYRCGQQAHAGGCGA